MGWLLTNTPQRRSLPQARRRQPHQPWDPQRTLKGLVFLGAMSCAVSIVFIWRYAEDRLAAYTAALDGACAQVFYPDRIELADAPPWMSPAVRQTLTGLIAQQIDANPFGHNSLKQAVFVLSTNPWVERVNKLERVHPGRLRVYAQYRQPIAVVEGRDGYHLVDHQATRLPGRYLKQQVAHLRLPVIVGVSFAPPHPGQRWRGRDLQAALGLAQTLSDQPYLGQIQSIDASDRDTRNRIRLLLHTDRGLVRWGLPPGQEQGLEPAAEIKKQRLALVYRQRGAIDAGGKVVDLFGPAVFVHQPMPLSATTGAYGLR